MIINYYKMFKKRGIRLPILYFFNVHLFDLFNGTDTQNWLPKKKYNRNLKNLNHGILYMAAWTEAINWSFNYIHKFLGKDFKKFKFVDIGCGKGKVLITWAKNCEKNNLPIKICGIDYYKPLISIAKQNLKKTNLNNKVKLKHQDIINFKFQKKKTIFFLYNPFNLNILSKIIKKLSNRNYLIIYNNPVHLNYFKKNNFIEIGNYKKFHKSQSVSILSYNVLK